MSLFVKERVIVYDPEVVVDNVGRFVMDDVYEVVQLCVKVWLGVVVGDNVVVEDRVQVVVGVGVNVVVGVSEYIVVMVSEVVYVIEFVFVGVLVYVVVSVGVEVGDIVVDGLDEGVSVGV